MRTKPVAPDTLTNIEVVTYALAILGGLERAVHLEEIAVKSRELAPGAFRWDLDQYATYIDKDKVRVSLTDAEKDIKGALVRAVGATRVGRTKRTDLWRLTAAGSAWVTDSRARLSQAIRASLPAIKRGRAQDLTRQIVESALYKQYRGIGVLDYSPYDFADLLECSPDASNAVIRDRLEALRGQVALLGDRALVTFLDECGRVHHQMVEG